MGFAGSHSKKQLAGAQQDLDLHGDIASAENGRGHDDTKVHFLYVMREKISTNAFAISSGLRPLFQDAQRKAAARWRFLS